MTSFLRSFFKAPEMDPVMAPVMGPVASPTANNAVCDSEGFYQHLGECWNDTIQMIFLFSDGIKEIIQPALLDPNFDSKVESIINDEKNKLVFTFKTDLSNLKTTKTMKNFANPFGLANSLNSEILDNKVSERKKAIIEYFKVLKRRFMRHYMNEHIRRHSLCDEETANEHSIFETMSQISRAAGQDGIAAAALGHINTKGVNRSHINIEELRKKREEKKYSPGGTITDEIYLFKLYNLVFFDKYEFKYNIFNLQFESIGIFSFPIELSKISKDLIQNSKAVDITSYIIDEVEGEKSEGHATAFYTCGGSQIYYDDNSGIYSFPWKDFLLKAVELYEKDDMTQLIFGNNKEGYDKIEIQRSSYYPIIRTNSYEANKKSYKYYTFIDNSLLLESNDGYFEYNGVSINVPNRSLRKITDLVFITINNNQAVNAQRFNHTARHGLLNWDYFFNFLIIQPNPDAEKILEFLNKYIELHNFKNDKFFKEMLTYGIKLAIIQVRDTSLNIKLLELAEAYLDPTEVEELRKLTIPDPPHVGGYRKKRKTRHRKQSIKRKTLKNHNTDPVAKIARASQRVEGFGKKALVISVGTGGH
jgi:hypothetical protein